MKINQPKPGRYTPQCPKCGRRLLIVVSEDSAAPPSVALFNGDVSGARTPTAAAQAAQTDPNATADFASSQTANAHAHGAVAETMAPAAPTAPAASAVAATIAPAARPAAPVGDDTTGFDMPEAPAPSGQLSGTLGGYHLLKQLGKGGMGAVYLAKQVSLDRNVAVKVMRSDWARDPTFVARFTREAFAAAQLVHHHVVQIYDIGVEKQNNYFSMELVDGQTLSELVAQQGKLDPEVAVGYVLQAARGLAFAHQQGMVHRDIKPDNLLINRHGIVKVADLGIVKVPGGTGQADVASRPAAAGALTAVASGAVTMAGVAMGTPHYMAPEQARDAAGVDARADIYSLGCTLYMLLTGQPPFSGKTAIEVITKHASEAVVPPDVVVKRVPKNLSEIILKMVAKEPTDRYANMNEVIQALEGFLGVDHGRPFSPREEHAAALEQAAAAFYAPPLARWRGKIAAAWFGGLALITVILAPFSPALAIGCLGVMLLTPLAHLAISGISEKTFVFGKLRELAFSAGIGGWIKAAAGLLLLLVMLYALGWLWISLAATILSGLLALGYYAVVDRSLRRARRESLESAEQLLKTLRLNGLEEDSLRQFVCRYAGLHWEEFYEALFGYEAKLSARSRWGLVDRGTARPKFAAWREPLVRWVDARVKAKKLARERKHLAAMEEMGLRASGVDPAEAKRLAEEKTKVLIAKVKAKDVKAAPEPAGNHWSRPLTRIVGPEVRFFGGAALLACGLLWMHQNNLVSSQELKSAAAGAMRQAEQGQLDQNQIEATKKMAGSWLERAKSAKPLALPFVPISLTAMVSHFCVAAAGLMLVISSLPANRFIATILTLTALALFSAQWIGLP